MGPNPLLMGAQKINSKDVFPHTLLKVFSMLFTCLKFHLWAQVDFREQAGDHHADIHWPALDDKNTDLA